MARVSLKTKDKLRIFELLRSHTAPGQKEGTVAYEEGWDDKRVANESGVPAANPQHVARLRSETLGLLYQHPGKGNGQSAKLVRLMTNFNSLCDNLGTPQFKV